VVGDTDDNVRTELSPRGIVALAQEVTRFKKISYHPSPSHYSTRIQTSNWFMGRPIFHVMVSFLLKGIRTYTCLEQASSIPAQKRKCRDIAVMKVGFWVYCLNP
jgi:hypothetical protein